MAESTEPILAIRDLCVCFHTSRGVVRAVQELDLEIRRGETLALVGESGCGKSVTAHAINRLIPVPGKIESGTVVFEGRDLLKLTEREMRAYRGDRISMVFQEPMTSLNPVFKVGDQIADVFVTHHRIPKKAARRKAVDLLDLVKIPAPEKRASSYPHQLSGGMRQRVMIALALASPNPGLLIADEPTTALDVTIQAQILELLRDLQTRIGMALLLITHDMGVVAENAQRVIVMYAGRKVEEGNVTQVLTSPSHPYTRGLLSSLPANAKTTQATRLAAIKGTVPDMISVGTGCPFHTRCAHRKDVCVERFPAAYTAGEGHRSWCHFAAVL